MDSYNKTVQIILNKVPHADGSHKTLTMHTNLIYDKVHCHEIFDYLEEKTNIPKKYFIIVHRNNTVRFVDAFIKYYHTAEDISDYAITPELPYDIVQVKVQANVDYHIYKYYSYCLNKKSSNELYNEFLKFADELFSHHKTVSVNDINYDPCYLSYKSLFNAGNLYHSLSPIKRFRISTNIELLKKKYQRVEGKSKMRIDAAL